MKFHVISKKDGHYTAEADTLEALASEGFENDPFMVVAAGTVAEGEDYQAIQVHEDTVLINSKPGHRYITANSIAEAFGGSSSQEEGTEDTYDDGDDTKITLTYVSEYGTVPEALELTEAASVELPTLSFDDNDNTYEFLGWKNGSKSVSGTINVTKDTRLTANWKVTPKTYVIKYIPNPSTPADDFPADKTVSYGYTLTAEDLPEITCFGFTFDKWYYDSIMNAANVGDTVTSTKFELHPLFIAKTYEFTSYASDKETQYATGKVMVTECVHNGKIKVLVQENTPEDPNNPFIGKEFYVNVASDSDGLRQLYNEDLEELPVYVRVRLEDSL